MAGKVVGVVGGELNLAIKESGFGGDQKDVGHTGLNLNHYSLQEELKCRIIMDGAELLWKVTKRSAVSSAYHG